MTTVATPVPATALAQRLHVWVAGGVQSADEVAAFRTDPFHADAVRVRPELQKIGARFGANVKIVEVPPGPPVLRQLPLRALGPSWARRAS